MTKRRSDGEGSLQQRHDPSCPRPTTPKGRPACKCKWRGVYVIGYKTSATGKKTANAKFIKVIHNGQLIHENIEVTGPTRAAAFEDEKPLGPLMFQGDHGPIAYRNICLVPLKAE
jgi:hypothetical protein